MSKAEDREQWKRGEAVLARIGAVVFTQDTEVQIRLPRTLADEAVSAWHREYEAVELSREAAEQSVVRTRAGTLALIGSALEDGGWQDGDEVVVKLDVWLIGDALTTADEAGVLEQ